MPKSLKVTTSGGGTAYVTAPTAADATGYVDTILTAGLAVVVEDVYYPEEVALAHNYLRKSTITPAGSGNLPTIDAHQEVDILATGSSSEIQAFLDLPVASGEYSKITPTP